MNFDISLEEAKVRWGKWLAYSKDADDYDILVFIDTDDTCGFLPKSDVICVFENRSGVLVAFTERVEKANFSKFGRWRIVRKGLKLRDTVYGYEGFINKKGEFIEYQFYKRWWYDIARDVNNLPNNIFHANTSKSRKDT